MKKTLVLFGLIFLWGCAHFAVSHTEKKKPDLTPSEISRDANAFFWENFHAGNYDKIPEIIQRLNIALRMNPNDLVTTDHLAFTHIWALAERQRLNMPDPAIPEHVMLARRYFDEAYQMNSKDPRILGFYADMGLAEGGILNNKKEQTAAYFSGLKCIKQWPQFNKFTVGYVFSSLSKDDKFFKKGLSWQYESLNDCACEVKGGSNLSDKKKIEAVYNARTDKVKRACGNTWIAPHNMEGFFMNFGDMLIKSGNVTEGVRVYELAKQSKTYDKWVYKQVLEERIKNAKENATAFNQPLDEMNLHKQKVIMFNSEFSCMGCHAMSKDEQTAFGNTQPPLSFYISHK